MISLIDPDNLASIRVALRLGERLQGRSSVPDRGEHLYGIDRESYTALLDPAVALACDTL